MVTQQSLTEQYGLNAADQQTRLAWVQITDRDTELIQAAAAYLRPVSGDVAREFYDHSFGFPAFGAKVTESASNRGALEGAQEGLLPFHPRCSHR